MLIPRTGLYVVFSLFLFVISQVSSQLSQFICTSKEIFDKKVDNCACRDFENITSGCTECDVKSLTCGTDSNKGGLLLKNCEGDCTSPSNSVCTACGVWLSLLCECLKSPGSCKESQPVGGWFKLNSKLATPDQPLPNILNLLKNPTLAPITWNFGQEVADMNSQGLAINSARTITQDQVHMHICPANTNMKSALAKLNYDKYVSLNEVQLDGVFAEFQRGEPKKMWCLASKPTSTITGSDVNNAISSVLGMGVCDYQVAAAMIKDSNGYTWACVTADRGDTEHRFLIKPC